MIYKIIRRVLFIAFIYLSLIELYNNIILIISMYDHLLVYYSDKYKHTSYIYDCLYASCFPENNYIKCKCLLD
jgi:hypothetical protein